MLLRLNDYFIITNFSNSNNLIVWHTLLKVACYVEIVTSSKSLSSLLTLGGILIIADLSNDQNSP